MSGTLPITLGDRPAGGVVPLLPGPGQQGPGQPEGRDLRAWHAALTTEIAARLSAAHAAILAEPVPPGEPGGRIVWRAPGARARAFADLSPEDRRALTNALGSILSDIRRAAESGESPALRAAWPALREVPDLDSLHAVDGRPVLSAWGHAPASGRPTGLLARFDDGRAWRAPPRAPWAAWGLAGGAVACLALAAGLLMPIAGATLFPDPAQCRLDTAGLTLMDDAARLSRRQTALEAELALVLEEGGRRRLACPIPRLPQPPPIIRQAEAPPAPPPPPRAATSPEPPRALPREAWDRGDLGMLDGCWRNTTDMQTRDVNTDRVNPVRSWEMCFDRSGTGRQTIIWTNGMRCDGPLRATFEGPIVRFTEPARCSGSTSLTYLGRHECRRLNDSEAECTRIQLDGRSTGGQTGRFRRP